MEPVVLALASNESYFPGLYCAIASALGYLDPKREVDVKVLDGGLSRSSLDTLSKLVGRMGKHTRLDFVTVDPSIFGNATLGPGPIAHGLLPDIATTLAGRPAFDLSRLRRSGISRSFTAF